jgi:hypothetical protein
MLTCDFSLDYVKINADYRSENRPRYAGPVMKLIRLQKFLAEAGACSRRKGKRTSLPVG